VKCNEKRNWVSVLRLTILQLFQEKTKVNTRFASFALRKRKPLSPARFTPPEFRVKFQHSGHLRCKEMLKRGLLVEQMEKTTLPGMWMHAW